MSETKSLIGINIHFLRQGVEILGEITDRHYTSTDSNLYSSSVGKHMRHVTDHYNCFITGLQGTVDYSARDREFHVESSRNKAINVMEGHMDAIRKIDRSEDLMKREVLIKCDMESDGLNLIWSASTVRRELQFLISHTVHHYALIALILRLQNFMPPDDFGVAPSTLAYRQINQQRQ